MSFSVISFSSLPNGGPVQVGDILAAQRGSRLYQVSLPGYSISLFPAVDLAAGDALTINGTGLIVPAQANTLATSAVIGFCQESVTVASGNPVIFSQVYAGGFASLTISDYYFLSAGAPGKITNTAPGIGNYLVPVGVAVSNNDIFINIAYPTLIT